MNAFRIKTKNKSRRSSTPHAPIAGVWWQNDTDIWLLPLQLFHQGSCSIKNCLKVFIWAGTTRTSADNIKYFLIECKTCSKSVTWDASDKRANSEGSLKEFYKDGKQNQKKENNPRDTHLHTNKNAHMQDTNVFY